MDPEATSIIAPSRVYLDMDETLIHAIITRGNRGRRVRVSVPPEKYDVMRREMADQMLADCRSIAPTVILTTATRDYAIEVNRVFGFGFSDEQILTREVYIEEREGEKDRAALVDTDRSAILIDNAEVSHQYAVIKRQFLGIDDSRYFKVRDFNGKDPDKFADEWASLVQQIRERDWR